MPFKTQGSSDLADLTIQTLEQRLETCCSKEEIKLLSDELGRRYYQTAYHPSGATVSSAAGASSDAASAKCGNEDRRHEKGEDRQKDPRESFASFLLQMLDGFFDSLAGIPHVRTLTYRDALEYFVTRRPDADVRRGAIVRAMRPNGYVIYQCFLDDKNHLVVDGGRRPLARRLRVDRFDAEIEEAFGGHNVIIVE
jgi:hypothetical protein